MPELFKEKVCLLHRSKCLGGMDGLRGGEVQNILYEGGWSTEHIIRATMPSFVSFPANFNLPSLSCCHSRLFQILPHPLFPSLPRGPPPSLQMSPSGLRKQKLTDPKCSVPLCTIVHWQLEAGSVRRWKKFNKQQKPNKTHFHRFFLPTAAAVNYSFRATHWTFLCAEKLMQNFDAMDGGGGKTLRFSSSLFSLFANIHHQIYSLYSSLWVCQKYKAHVTFFAPVSSIAK